MYGVIQMPPNIIKYHVQEQCDEVKFRPMVLGLVTIHRRLGARRSQCLTLSHFVSTLDVVAHDIQTDLVG